MKKVFLAIIVNDQNSIRQPRSINLLVACSVNPHRYLNRMRYDKKCTSFYLLSEVKTNHHEYAQSLVCSECNEYALLSSERLHILAISEPIIDIVFKIGLRELIKYQDLIIKADEYEKTHHIWEKERDIYNNLVRRKLS